MVSAIAAIGTSKYLTLPVQVLGARLPNGLNIKRMAHAKRSAASKLVFSKMHFKGTISGHTVDFQGTTEVLIGYSLFPEQLF
jgi:hypothetical protein